MGTERFPELSVTDGAGLETASPAKVRATAQPSTPGTSCQANLTPRPTNCAHQGLQVENKQGNSALMLACSGFVHRQIVSSSLCPASLAEHFIVLEMNFAACAVHCTCPRNPFSSPTDVNLLFIYLFILLFIYLLFRCGIYQPHYEPKQRLQLSRGSQERPRSPGTHSSDRKALGVTF